jgi:SNF2 family DNA or RNA helicase
MLLNYQKAAVLKLVSNWHFGLFFDMGLGKTLIVLEALYRLKYLKCIDKVLIIAPPRVVEHVWQQEAEKFGYDFTFIKLNVSPAKRLARLKKKADIYLLPTDLIKWLVDIKMDEKFNYVIIDEVSMFKNSTSNRFKAMKKMRQHVELFWGLTGTPTPNGLSNIWPLIYLIDQGKRLGRYKKDFQFAFLSPEILMHNRVVKWKLRKGAESKIYTAIADICMSNSPEDYCELPDFQTIIYSCSFDNKTFKNYRQFIKDNVVFYPNGDLVAANPGVLVNKLQQFTNGWTYLDTKAVEFQHNIKIEALLELLNSVKGNVLIFYVFKTDLDAILKSVPGSEKLNVDRWNRGEQKIALLHPASGGHGLNLQTGGNICIWFSPTWNLEHYMQSVKRLHRRGQKEKVLNYIITMDESIDVKIVQALERKKLGQDELLSMLHEIS